VNKVALYSHFSIRIMEQLFINMDMSWSCGSWEGEGQSQRARIKKK